MTKQSFIRLLQLTTAVYATAAWVCLSSAQAQDEPLGIHEFPPADITQKQEKPMPIAPETAPTQKPETATVSKSADEVQNVTVKVGIHPQRTRLVFNFPSLTAYKMSRDKEHAAIVFSTHAHLLLPKKTPPFLKHLSVAQNAANLAAVTLETATDATVKHYRVGTRVIVDVYAAQAAPATTPAVKKPPQETKPVDLTPKPQAEAVIAKKEPAPTPTPPPVATAAHATPAVPVTAVDHEKIEATAATQEPAQKAVFSEPTHLTFSSVEPAHIAVFRRWNALWVVLDTPSAGNFAPEITGPLAPMLGSPKPLRFKGGTAWRFTAPSDGFIDVKKHDLTWKVSISPLPENTAEQATLSVEKDEGSGKVKLLTRLRGAGQVMEFEDSSVGDTLYVVGTSEDNVHLAPARHFPDLEIIPAEAGMVLKPLKNDITVTRLEEYVLVTAPQGLLATPGALASLADTGSMKLGDNKNNPHLFDFPNWRQGGIKALTKNIRTLQDGITQADSPAARSEDLMKLALLYFANNFGHEAVAMLRLLEEENPDMAKNLNFLAVRGAAQAMAGHFDDALKDLSTPAIQKNPEVVLWTGYIAAANEEWRKASELFPKNNYLLLQYPENIAIPFTLYMAESTLRLGHTDAARTLLDTINTSSDDFTPHYRAALSYLRGEIYRQDGEFERAIRTWEPVAIGLDRLYHAKASLALANILLQEKKITLKEAIDRIDSLRFAWRGDGLEVQILNNLGRLKAKNRQYLDGLEDLKTATALSDNLMIDSAPIREEMSHIMSTVFTGNESEKISPLEAVSIYNEFSALLPPTKEAETASLHFADFLVRMDLLDKAEGILEPLAARGLDGESTVSIGTKLAAVYLMDGKPEKTLAALDAYTGTMDAKTAEERGILKARALSQTGKTDDAITALAPFESNAAKRLKVDILWHAAKWANAAAALEALLPATPPEKMDDETAHLVVNTAVAYKLAGNTAALKTLKEKYITRISTTSSAASFGVVTRDDASSSLADRDTLLKVAGEVDMFKGFLDTYKADAAK